MLPILHHAAGSVWRTNLIKRNSVYDVRKSAISLLRSREHNANRSLLDEKLASVPASGIPGNFRKLSRFFPVIVLVPKSAVGIVTQEKAGANNRY